MSTTISDSERRTDIAERTRQGLEEDLEDLRDRLMDRLERFEGRVRTAIDARPEWAAVEASALRAVFEVDDEELAETAWLGPRLVAIVAGEVEAFVFEWLPPVGAADEVRFDPATVEDFEREAQRMVDLLRRTITKADEEARRGHVQLDEMLEASFAKLDQLRDRDIDALEDLVGQGALNTGPDARQERATLWEEQRQKAEDLNDLWEAFHAMVDEGADFAIDGLTDLSALFERACEGLEGAYPGLDRSGVLDEIIREPVETDEESPAVEQATGQREKRSGAGGGTMPLFPEDGPGEGESGGVEESVGVEESEGDEGVEEAEKVGGAETIPAASPSQEFLRKPAGARETAPADAPPADEEPTREPAQEESPEESEEDVEPEAEAGPTQPVDFLGDESSHTEPLIPEESPVLDEESATERRRVATADGPAGDEEEKEEESAENDDPQMADTSLAVAETGEREEPVEPKVEADEGPESSRSEPEPERETEVGPEIEESDGDAEHSEPSEPSEVESPTDPQSPGAKERADEVEPAPDLDDSVVEPPSMENEEATPEREAFPAPLESQCIRIRTEWKQVEWGAIAGALGPPAGFLLAMVAIGLAHLAGLSAAPNPVEAWSWTEASVGVALVWCLCAPMILRWYPRWDGWSFSFVRESDIRDDADLVLDAEGFSVDRISFRWPAVKHHRRKRWEAPDDEMVGWLLVVEPAYHESVKFIAPAHDLDRWESSGEPVVEPPSDAWQIDDDAFERLEDFLEAI